MSTQFPLYRPTPAPTDTAAPVAPQEPVGLDHALWPALNTAPSLRQAAAGSQALSGVVAPRTTARRDDLLAGLAHFSFFGAWLLGPFLVHTFSARGTRARREAAKAFNFQLIAFVVMVVGSVLRFVPGVEMVLVLATVAWLALTVVGGVKAAKGQDWTNPVTRAVGWQALDER